jgi:hypothetical protein
MDLSNGNVYAKLTGTFYVNEGNPIADEFSNSKRNKK